jgi:hypothetical protein
MPQKTEICNGQAASLVMMFLDCAKVVLYKKLNILQCLIMMSHSSGECYAGVPCTLPFLRKAQTLHTMELACSIRLFAY